MTMNLDFDFPWMLVLLPLAALPLLRRRSDTLVFSSVAWLPADELGRVIGWLTRGGAALAIAAIVVGLAGPGRSQLQVLRTGSGAQILILMDRSASMDEPMGSKGVETPRGDSKNQVARAALTRFVEQRPNDRLAFMMFGTNPVLAMPFTYNHRVIEAGVAATAIGRGMPDTELDRGMLAAIAQFDGSLSSGRRAIVLVSDGGALLDETMRQRIQTGLQRNQIALYFIYLRSSVYSPDLNATLPASESSAEAQLHRFFLSLETPYRLFQAEDPKAMMAAIAEINRQQNASTTFIEHLPRQDLSRYCFALALFCAALLVLLYLLQVRSWA
ncbi:VWA domain-containing protein [Paraburkholderia sp. MMS20-SJTN17]|uniref:VWA domain-containing protein n=1 Tax=Paraburkholderia translucens TaxID=2886945 RepID=A0ABS8KF94_9BURK|nr:vWA domain-containing protein [Paraburkholderia sp. MMS20-SJTN17]MCC8403118.1 VWA domain-containing protein [Paraburkholderia sp. MMS20-SJTN17]